MGDGGTRVPAYKGIPPKPLKPERVARRTSRRSPLILILVENLPLPGDRRVWLECTSLRDAGYRVAAITPKAEGDPVYELLDGVHLYKYRPPRGTSGSLSFAREFIYCWLATLRLVCAVIRRHGRPLALQACNPPDTFWLIALLLRPLGTKFVFDQHDLCPEVYESKFQKRGIAHRMLLAFERATYRCADHVISTNESYKRIAMDRGAVDEHDITVVRTGPDTSVLRRVEPNLNLLRGCRYLVHFHGVMGPQDGVDTVIEAARQLRRLGRTDVFFNIMGTGDEYHRLRHLVTDYGLAETVYMPGRVPDDELFESMSTAVVGLSPDRPGPLNDVSTMNKTMEYMAFGLPVLAFDLPETRVSAGDSAYYVERPTAWDYAVALIELIDDPARRAAMAEEGVWRARDELDWQWQRPAYLTVYERLVGAPVSESRSLGLHVAGSRRESIAQRPRRRINGVGRANQTPPQGVRRIS